MFTFKSNKINKKSLLTIKNGNNIYQLISSKYNFSIDPLKKELYYNNDHISYERIWITEGIDSLIILEQDSNYIIIGKYQYRFEIPNGHNKDIIDFRVNNHNNLYGISSSHTYLFAKEPLYILNNKRTTYDPYQQLENKNINTPFIPLNYYQESCF